MLSERAVERGAERECLLPPRWLSAALVVLLLLSSTVTFAHSTTVEHDFHIVHNVDNRSPEINPFWYLGRGVRPIGRFGKRHSGMVALGRGVPAIDTLELLLSHLRHRQDLEQTLDREERDWLP